ncbi:MAG: hypothetical protein J6U16_06080 [Ruminococcus sp.]|nr:hypothetical protein [Ruminococcus sp.]
MKRCIIWAVIMLVVLAVLNIIGTVVHKFVVCDMLTPTMTGYVAKSEEMLHPQLKENGKTNGLERLYIRQMLDNSRIESDGSIIPTLLFIDIKADQSIILFDGDGMNQFSKGTFAAAYEETEEKLDGIKRTIGLVSVDELCGYDESKELCDVLEKHIDANLRLDSYTIDDYLVTPVKVTVIDGSGSELKSIEFPSSGEVIERENIYIYGGSDLDSEVDRSERNSLYTDMKTAYLGERRADKIAEKLAKKVDLSRDETVTKYRLGFGHVATRSYEVADGRAMVWVFDSSYMKSILIWAGIICVPVTLLVFLLGRRKKNDY